MRAVAATALAGVAALLGAPREARGQGIGLEELKEEMSWGTAGLLLFDELEYAALGVDGNPVGVDATGWYGGAYDRLWVRIEGEQLTTDSDGEGELQLYYGRLVTSYWDALIGARVDGQWGGSDDLRAHFALGITGLAPLRFELSPTVFVSHEGDVSFRLEAEYELLLTQRLVVAPKLELDAAIGDAPDWGVATGLSEVELALRLRYDIWPELGPYVGFVWLRRVGDTADLARDEGEEVSEPSLVVGLRLLL